MKPDLITLDHKQPATPLKTDTSTTEGFLNLGMKPKCSKPWDMKWHWLRDNAVRDQLRVYWYRGTKNDAYYKKITLQFTIVKCDLGIYIPQI